MSKCVMSQTLIQRPEHLLSHRLSAVLLMQTSPRTDVKLSSDRTLHVTGKTNKTRRSLTLNSIHHTPNLLSVKISVFKVLKCVAKIFREHRYRNRTSCAWAQETECQHTHTQRFVLVYWWGLTIDFYCVYYDPIKYTPSHTFKPNHHSNLLAFLRKHNLCLKLDFPHDDNMLIPMQVLLKFYHLVWTSGHDKGGYTCTHMHTLSKYIMTFKLDKLYILSIFCIFTRSKSIY